MCERVCVLYVCGVWCVGVWCVCVCVCVLRLHKGVHFLFFFDDVSLNVIPTNHILPFYDYFLRP